MALTQIYNFKLIDGLKAKGKHVESTNIVDNILLSFVTKNVSDEGEVLKSSRVGKDGNLIYKTPYKEAQHKGLRIAYSENKNFRISGSIHKYYNNGLHNYNDFSEDLCKLTIIKLCNEFEIHPSAIILENLEIGINFLPPIKTNDILDLCFLHSTKPFESKYDNEYGKYIQCVHSQYLIKIYNKALHYTGKGYEFEEEIMRFEIKFLVMEKLNKLGIYTLDDLMNFDFSLFKVMLLKEWNKILFFESSLMNMEGFNLKYASQIFWKDLINRESLSAYYKHRNKLNRFSIINSSNVKSQVNEAVSLKIDKLISGGYVF